MGENIQKLREKHKLTRAQLGALIGKSEATIYAYETGKAKPTVDVLLMLSSLFDVSPNIILGVKGSLASAGSVRDIFSLYLDMCDDKKVDDYE